MMARAAEVPTDGTGAGPLPAPAGLLRALLVVLLAAPVASAAQEPPANDAERAARVDALMAAHDVPDRPGAVVAVVRDGAVVFAKGYGAANLEHGIPLGRASVLDVGSVSKQFTAFAIVLLEQEGKLSLDDDVRTHLPEVPDFGPTITVRHLVHHTSGLREIYNASSLAGWQPGDGIAQEDALHLTRRMRELNFDPGTEYVYCNTGYMLLADIVARVSGMSFPDFMEERVFGPLGMEHTTIMSRFGQSIPGAAESYGPLDEGGFVRIFDNSSIQGAGGIYTTVDDLARWMGNYGTGTVGGPGAIERMQRRGVLTSGDTLSYAFGINVGERRGLRTIAHGGSSAGYRASFTYFPELRGGVITLSNHARFDPRVPQRVAELWFGDRMEPTSPAADADADEEAEGEDPAWLPPASELRALAGRYFSPELETVYTLSVRDGGLTASHRRHADFELEPVEPDVFRARNFFGTARFVRDAAGVVTGMRVSNGRVRNLLFERLAGGP